MLGFQLRRREMDAARWRPGRLINVGGKLPVNLLVGAYYNALRPEGGATWQLRTQVAIVF